MIVGKSSPASESRKADKRPKIIVIQGPTASGKTGLAVEVAERFGGEIVNADSLQWIREFDAGTAKPTPEERARAVFHLVDVFDPADRPDAGCFVDLARHAIADIFERGCLPIIAGGTALYVRTLLGGLVELPSRNDDLRAGYDAVLEDKGAAGLAELLLQKDPTAQNHIDLQNPVRVVRALEVLDLTGLPIQEHQARHRFAERPYRALRFHLDVDLDSLDHRIHLRTAIMLESGLIEEALRLLARYGEDCLPMRSIGYRQVAQCLAGEFPESQVQEKIETATRRYARKQIRWMNKEDSRPIRYPEQLPEVLEMIEEFLSSDV